MDGRGRALDKIFVERLMKQLAIRLSEQTTLAKSLVIWRSVKYEDVYLKGYSNPMELMIGLTEYFVFYNGERPHQSLGNRTPTEVYVTRINGGARIVDKFSKNGAASCSCVKDGQTSLN
jgi:putative transposase